MAQCIYFANNTSGFTYWNLTNSPLIPAGATLTSATMSWSVSKFGYGGMHEGLFDAAGYGEYWLYSGVTNSDTNFFGKQAKQKWESEFYVTSWNSPGNPLQVNPQLSICFAY